MDQRVMVGQTGVAVIEEEVPTFSDYIFHNLHNLKEAYCSNPRRKVNLVGEDESVVVSLARCRACYQCYLHAKRTYEQS